MFEGKSHFFIRSASSPARVSLCEDNSYHAIKEISTEDFCKWLTKMYALQDLRLTFRNIVSLYSRVWNKPNQVVNHPLSNYNNQSVAESITTLIKLFKRYDPIRELHEESLFLKKRSAIRKYSGMPSIPLSCAENIIGRLWYGYCFFLARNAQNVLKSISGRSSAMLTSASAPMLAVSVELNSTHGRPNFITNCCSP